MPGVFVCACVRVCADALTRLRQQVLVISGEFPGLTNATTQSYGEAGIRDQADVFYLATSALLISFMIFHYLSSLPNVLINLLIH